jgi:hypothetical protein
MTRTPISASFLTVVLTSIASRPSRSSLVTMSTSPDSSLSISRGKAAALRNGGAAGNGLGDDTAWLDVEAGGFDFLNLVFGGLSGRGDTDIGKGAWHKVNFVRIGCPKYDACSQIMSR